MLQSSRPTVYIETYGCQMNVSDTELMLGKLTESGYDEVAQPDQADVIRINTELVQTDVMVFDKQGRFVDGLQPEEFELSLEGTTQTISFFERVAAGSSKEAAQLAAFLGRELEFVWHPNELIN